MTQYSGKIIRKTPVTPSQSSASGVWKTTDVANAVRGNTWPVPGVPNPISRSLRFRSSASAYLSRTLTTPTNNLKWTWSGWIKRGTLGATNIILDGGDGSSNNFGSISFRTDDTLQFSQVNGGAYNVQVYTTAVFRDPAAWYHIVFVYDSANATSTDRVQFYVNGVRYTSLTYATGPFAQNTASKINSAIAHYIGKLDYTGIYLDGYLTEVNFIDGQALTPSSFGTTDASTGAWIPMPYTGTYGANGFYLNFKDNTSTTTLGYDYSGNSNNWTTNNISLTSGSTYDSMLDVPTPWVGYNTGDTSTVTRGNYATFNPITGGSSTCSDGNLAAVFAPINGARVSSIGVTSGKWYAEFVYTSIVGYAVIGIGAPYLKGWNTTQESNANCVVKYSHTSGGMAVGSWTMPTSSLSFTYTTGNVIGIALDMDTSTVTFYKDGVNSGNFTFTSGGDPVCFLMGNSDAASNGAGYANFGQRPFAYTPPAGFKTLCTTNLPEPTIKKGNAYFDVLLHTGNGGAQSVTGANFQPDMAITKARSQANSHTTYDSVRGATNALFTNTTGAELNYSAYLAGFLSNGVSFIGGGGDTNQTSATYVNWLWKKGATPGFDIVTYTGNATNRTIAHSLGVAPSMMIIKNRQAANSWVVYHVSTGNGNVLLLNSTNASTADSTAWNTTSPTSSVFSVGTGAAADTNQTTGGGQHVAYLFAEVAGFSRFGSYTGNGSTDGPFVYCGFRPRYLLIKNSSIAASWEIIDTSRDPYNVAYHDLYAESSSAESTGTNRLDIVSNGFKVRDSNTFINGSGNTVIYAAFAENPFKYSNAR